MLRQTIYCQRVIKLENVGRKEVGYRKISKMPPNFAPLIDNLIFE